MSGMVENCPKISQLFFENIGDSHFLKIPITINISLNAVLALSATLGNGIIIVAILRSKDLQTPSYLLITSLAFTDLLIGLVFHPLVCVLSSHYLQGKAHEVCQMTKPAIFFGILAGFGSMLMVTCISIDRYLALTLRHRYNITVTKKRVCLSIVFAWSSVFLLAILNMPEELFDIAFVADSFFLLILFSITCVFYIKSFRALHLYTVQVQAQQPNPLAGNFDVVRYKKTLRTMLVVLVCLVLCQAPNICSLALISFFDIKRLETVVFYYVALALSCFNSTINPIIYLIRFKDIRNTCVQMFKKSPLTITSPS